MKKITKIFITTVSVAISIIYTANAQVAINNDGSTPDASAMLDVKSDTAGILVPRMTAAQRDAINNPAIGLLIFVTSDSTFYYYDNNYWVKILNEHNTDDDWVVNGINMYSGISGNVGIGTSSPDSKFQVYSNGLGVDISRGFDALGGITFHEDNTTNAQWIFPFFRGWQSDNLIIRDDIAHIDVMTFEYGTGKVGIGTVPNVKFQIDGGTDASLSNGSGYAVIGAEDGTNIVMDNNEIIARNNGVSSKLFIQSSGSTASTILNADGGNVGVGTTSPDASAVLDLNSSAKGFLPPRMTATQMNAIASPSAGLMVYNTTINSICFYDGSRWKNVYEHTGESCGPISYGGQTYQTVIIGTQCWMAENLNIGTMISGSDDQTDNDTIEKYCYNDNTTNCDTYGGLYQWNEMMDYVTTNGSQGICPPGWHLPTDDEYKTLEMNLGMTQAQTDSTGWRGTDEGSKLAGNEVLWTDGNLDQNTNFGTSGFDALPGGNRRYTDSSFYDLAYSADFWSSSEYGSTAWYRHLYYYSTKLYQSSYNKAYGFSVRCLRD